MGYNFSHLCSSEGKNTLTDGGGDDLNAQYIPLHPGLLRFFGYLSLGSRPPRRWVPPRSIPPRDTFKYQ